MASSLAAGSAPADAAPVDVRPVHLARLKSLWRSAGWPCRDAIELDLLAARWIAVERDGDGRETLRVTEAGLDLLAAARRRRSRGESPHDRLAARIGAQLVAQGRIVWRELSLRARVALPQADDGPPLAMPGLPFLHAAAEPQAVAPSASGTASAWRVARPDVFSIRNTSVEQYLHPVVHEIKVNRADLLSDLRNPAKGAAYAALSCETCYVFPADVATPEEIPEPFGVWIVRGSVDDGAIEIARPARHTTRTLPFAVWMALARSTPSFDVDTEPAQPELAAAPDECA